MNNNLGNLWLKNRGYLHLTQQVDVIASEKELLSKISSPEYVAKYAFYPLLHAVIKERRYKKISSESNARSHVTRKDGVVKTNSKSRPLHYATHMDALIFGYYSELLQGLYEAQVAEVKGLSDCIIAYRRLLDLESGKNKSSIHFARDVFNAIKEASQDDCVVMTFDLKSFFSSMDHGVLKAAWIKVLKCGQSKLPCDHFNVFKAATQFSYILKDDLRADQNRKGVRSGFDEKRLAYIRNGHGIQSFFETPKEFREAIKCGNIKIHKYPFRNVNGIPIGIPQGLPISATLANLYLFDFDVVILESVVKKLSGFYRRYSDDIVVVCKKEEADFVEKLILDEVQKSRVEISKDKTEKFLFKYDEGKKGEKRVTSHKYSNGIWKKGIPFTYLGFEFYGHNTLIKSANLAKFYRRMIYSVKRKSKRAFKVANNNPSGKPIVFTRQLHKLYINYSDKSLNSTKVTRRWKKLVKNSNGEFRLVTRESNKPLRSNYLSYVKRASDIMDSASIKLQIRNHKKIFNQALHRHFFSKL